MKNKVFYFTILIAFIMCLSCCAGVSKNSRLLSESDIDSDIDSETHETSELQHTDGYFIITFIQENQKNVYRQVKSNEDLLDIPTPIPVIGCNVEWDICNFENIVEDFEVNAIITKNDYYIYYNVGDGVSATISDTKTLVHYGEEFTLLIPRRSGYDFIGWKIEGTQNKYTNGVFESIDNVYLVAEWEAKSTEWINPFI